MSETEPPSEPDGEPRRRHTAIEISRRAARLIVLATDGRQLLVQYRGGSGPFWATPGGGLNDAEDFETAARREAHEELGLPHIELSSLWEGVVEYQAQGRSIRQLERFFLVRDAPLNCAAARAEHEGEGILALRWWSRSELESTEERFFPEDLLARLAEWDIHPRHRSH